MKNFLFLGSLFLVFSCNKEKEIATPESLPPTAEVQPAVKLKGDKNLPGFALISASDCTSCHKDSEKMIGPSYAEIAAKYSEKDLEILAQKIVEGGSGNWGQVPMAAHPQISKEEAKTMVKYILSVK